MVGGGMGRRDSTHDGRPAIILPSLYLQEKLLPPSLFAGELLSPRIQLRCVAGFPKAPRRAFPDSITS